jgi:ketosteroid isomerase-like protein
VTESERIVRSFFATLSSGDLEALGSFFDDRSTWTICARDIAGAGTHTGRHAIIEGFLRPVRGLFEPGQPSVEVTRVIGEGPVVAVEATGRGRLLNGNEYDNRYAYVIELEGSIVRALSEYMDTHHAASVV